MSGGPNKSAICRGGMAGNFENGGGYKSGKTAAKSATADANFAKSAKSVEKEGLDEVRVPLGLRSP
jgi:hypothetical protein